LFCSSTLKEKEKQKKNFVIFDPVTLAVELVNPSAASGREQSIERERYKLGRGRDITFLFLSSRK
jgi:hypothetical protein